MTSMLLRTAMAAVRGWTRLYTRGIDPDARDRRIREIESDLWESQADAAASLPAALGITARLAGGVLADLRWRNEHRVNEPVVIWFAKRFAGVTAVVGLIIWLTVPMGAAAPLVPDAPQLTMAVRIDPRQPPPPPPPPPCAPAWTGLPEYPGCTFATTGLKPMGW